MKKISIFYVLLLFIFCACEDSSDYGNVEPNQGLTTQILEEVNVVLDGQETSVFLDDKGEIYVEDKGVLKALKEFSEGGSPGFYMSGEFEGIAVFSSEKKLKEFLNAPEKMMGLTSKMHELNPIKEDEISTKGSTNMAASTLVPSVTIATAHSLGGYDFTTSLESPYYGSTPYANAHLRCNQYETDCINFNDDISSLKVVNATACFYEGSFEVRDHWLYINALNKVITVPNLQDVKLDENCNIACQSFNDKITSFWADANFRSEVYDYYFDTGYFDCGHNYNDPACGSGGGGSGGGGGTRPGPGNGGIQ